MVRGMVMAVALSAWSEPVPAIQPVGASPWDVLKNGMAESNPDKRMQTLAAMGTMIAQPEAVRMVEAALRDRSALVRRAAAAALGQMNDPSVIPHLKQALADQPEAAFAAAESLWKLGDTTGRTVFQKVLTGEVSAAPGMLKGELRDARRKLHSPEQLAFMGVKQASGAFLGPAYMGVVFAEQALKDKGAPGRVAAISYLEKDSDPYALTLLEWALQDKSSSVRAAAAQALGQRGNQDSIAKLKPLLADPSAPVRYMAAASSIRLGEHAHATGSENARVAEARRD